MWFEDANGNGQMEAGETILATTEVQQVVDALSLDIVPPLVMPPASEVYLLITLDVNTAVGATAATGISRFSLSHRPLLFAGLVASLSEDVSKLWICYPHGQRELSMQMRGSHDHPGAALSSLPRYQYCLPWQVA
jgi:hypothetical protein